MSFLATLKSLFGFSSGPRTASAGDRTLSCEDCNQKFIFDEGEQRFFKTKGFTDPKRCPRCRKKVRGFMRKKFKGRRNGGGGGHHFSRKNSLIDGDSPYADER